MIGSLNVKNNGQRNAIRWLDFQYNDTAYEASP